MRTGFTSPRSCLLGNLLDHPEVEVGGRLFDPEPFQLGGDLTAVVGGLTGGKLR